MGRYINPGAEGFREIVGDNYIDKTGIIEIINQSIGKKRKLFCISRPRRFGKTYAALTLCAYYDCSVDSHELFDQFEISKSDSYEKHMNAYNVICFDMASLLSELKRNRFPEEKFPEYITQKIKSDVIALLPETAEATSVSECLLAYVKHTKRKFIFIIDEWDAVIRESNTNAQTAYLEFLREIFKNTTFTPQIVAAAYMTGILPIKKDRFQSAISDFMEYSVLNPGKFARFIGFDQADVHMVCKKFHMDYEKMKWWYDGYTFGDVSEIYNPYSVMNAVEQKKFGSYWKKSSAADSLMDYIDMNFEGLQEDVIRLVKDDEIAADTDNYQNDFTTFVDKDDVLTLLIHLGYLTYNSDTHSAHIPNEEIRSEFRSMLRRAKNPKLINLVARSKKLLEDTLAGNEMAVGEAIDKLCETNYAPMFYNNEQALRSTIKLAYLAAVDHYVKVEELPSGKGLADIVYLPQKGSNYPIMIVELKWNKRKESAIQQIKQRNYPAVLEDHGSEFLLVGITYDVNDKKHLCQIEKICIDKNAKVFL